MSAITKALLYCVLFLGIAGVSISIYLAYQDYVNPEHVYGEWIEVGAPSYATDVIILSKKGVSKNGRFLANEFKFDGKNVTIETGDGVTIFESSDTFGVPKLNRIFPESPNKKFVKKGYEKKFEERSRPGRYEMLRKSLQKQ
ncbi:DUF2850 domain-containing protein [Vibrio sp. S4M6]|uniref:DUF2850 domain-containing protein n=1 Tax=Vibrio sinus TaxID=2946865 RepID=UPI00202A8C44|nr:DUF2850 domain-containing protein [Vibrio sinus]MCL9783249.1 DUF2850 domain-containing protein [Vibrio sinus]